MKNLIIFSLAGLMLFFYRQGQNERYERFNLIDEHKALKVALDERDSIITESYKYHNRIRIMLGVDSMQGVIAYKDLLKVNYKGVNKYNKMDLR